MLIFVLQNTVLPTRIMAQDGDTGDARPIKIVIIDGMLKCYCLASCMLCGPVVWNILLKMLLVSH